MLTQKECVKLNLLTTINRYLLSRIYHNVFPLLYVLLLFTFLDDKLYVKIKLRFLDLERVLGQRNPCSVKLSRVIGCHV